MRQSKEETLKVLEHLRRELTAGYRSFCAARKTRQLLEKSPIGEGAEFFEEVAAISAQIHDLGASRNGATNPAARKPMGAQRPLCRP